MMILAAILASTVASYGLCNPRNFPKVVNAPLQSTATKVITVNGSNTAVSATGTVTAIDGCSFSVDNFVLNAPEGYGGFAGSDDAVRLTQTEVVPSKDPYKKTYNFITAAGRAVSFNDFDQLRLFSVPANAMIATADMRTTVGSSSGSTSGSTPSVNNTQYPTASTGAPKATTSLIVNGASGIPNLAIGGFLVASLALII